MAAARTTTLAVCVVVMAVLGGCSGDGEKTSPADDGAAPTTVAGATTTVRPVDTSFTGQGSAEFCALAKTYDERSTNVGSASTPAQLRAVTQEGRAAIDQAVTAAPAEIKPDVEVLAAAFTTVITELERVDFDATRVSAAAFAALQTPEFQTSTTRFQAYTRDVCRVTG